MKQYEYKIPRLITILGFLLFTPMAWYGFHNASLHKGVTKRGIQLLTGTPALCFWIITSCIFLVIALVSLYGLIKSFGNSRFITIDDVQITAPTKPISDKFLTIPYHEITNYKLHSTGKIKQLIIKSPQGKITLSNKNFSKSTDFDEIVQLISQKVKT